MQTILEHTKIIGRLKHNKIMLDLIRKYNIQDILNCCQRLETKGLNKDLYAENSTIQNELIIDNQFIEYLLEIGKRNIDTTRIKDLVFRFQENKQKVSDYKLETILQILENENMSSNAFYDYLVYFSKYVTTKEQQDIIANNFSYFYNQEETKMSDLTENERALFFEYFMSDRNLIPIHHIKEVCEFLIQDNELKNIILFLFDNNLSIPLYLREYELIHKNSKAIYEIIQRITLMLDNQNMYQLLLRWVANDCSICDLKVLENKLKGLDKETIDKVVYNESSYINFIFGNKLSNFPLEYVDGARETLLIYAISNNKRRFLQLIQENSQEFLSISQSSILYDEDFYDRYVNLNTLTLKNLQDLRTMQNYRSNINLLYNNNYTFEEIKLLSNLSNQYLILYNELLDLKIDERMLIIKQLSKKDLLHKTFEDKELKALAQMLKKQNLYCWIEKDFAHIKELTPQSAIKILINYSKMNKYIPQIENETELLYVIRNIDKIQQYESLNDVKENIEDIDIYWGKLVDKMSFDKHFINENKNHIKRFLLNNGAELALTYCKGRYDYELATFKKIVKAELMGQFRKLKYYTDDLHREISFDLTPQQVGMWQANNMTISDGEIVVREYDDFYSTMILGELPQHTCLSYKNGMYNHCLMACFDSNKKILYAKIGSKIVARAMVRLTKGTYSNNRNNKNKLSFVDLENMQPDEDRNPEKDEYLTIFLEKAYISGLSPIEKNKIKNMFISLLEKKAVNMNALLVLSNFYSDVASSEYIVTRYYMYISKSKAGSQYLDSLSGENTVTEEGQYKTNTFMIWQNQSNENKNMKG